MPDLVSRPSAGDGARGPAADRAVSIADSLTMREWDELVTIVLRRLERRVREDLARRGRGGASRVM